MRTTRAILAVALVALAAFLAWVGLLPESESARASPLLFVPLPLVAAGVLFVWRPVGSVLALAAGIVGFGIGGALGLVAGISGGSTELAVAILAYLGLGVAAFAIIDIAALLLTRRSTDG